MRHTSDVEDADIDRMIDNLRMQRQGWNRVERAAKEGDLVTMENLSEVDGIRRPPEGAEKGSTVVGSGAMLKEIEDAVVGMSPGDEKTVQVDFPAEWRVPEFAGKTGRDPHAPARSSPSRCCRKSMPRSSAASA